MTLTTSALISTGVLKPEHALVSGKSIEIASLILAAPYLYERINRDNYCEQFVLDNKSNNTKQTDHIDYAM